MKKIRVDPKGDTQYLPGAFIDRNVFLARNEQVGALIPAATGLKRCRRIEIESNEPLPRGMDSDLLDGDNLAAELGLTDGEGMGFGSSLEGDLSDLERIGARGTWGRDGLCRGAGGARRAGRAL